MLNKIFLNNDQFSDSDHPSVLSLVSFVDTSRCNLNCIKCYNRTNETFDFITKLELLNKVISAKNIGAELFIISGGEPTLFVTFEFLDILTDIRKILPIRIDTNGILPNKVDLLSKYVDGFAVDIKIPLKPQYDQNDIYPIILGIHNDRILYQYSNNLLTTINIVDNMEYTIFRTVNYDILSIKDKYNISNFAKTLKSPHSFNDYHQNL